MLEKLNMTNKLEKEEYKQLMEELEDKLAFLQRECREKQVPVIIVFEGLGASGKGTMISKLIHPLDPRGFQVYAIGTESAEEQRMPFLWRFWTKTPAKGRIAIFDRSWYRRVLIDRFDGKTSAVQLAYAYDEISSFEEQLTKDGTILIKFFLSITREEQKKRFDKLLSKKASAWRVTEGDLARYKKFDEYRKINEEMLEKTDTDFAPWTLVEAMDKKFATVKILSTVIEYVSDKLNNRQNLTKSEEAAVRNTLPAKEIRNDSILKNTDLTLDMDRDTYKKKLKKLQQRLELLHGQVYRKKLPVILVFEGWDASGKGGAIKRLTAPMDPRGYVVNPVASPTETEKNHHYLWRFWNTLPKSGHVSIYDRSWYGRVMVERIEGFCSTAEWQRAYSEINQMEMHLAQSGAVVMKFWMHIDKEEQLARFKARQEQPEKSWKITEEDWRNREKWAEYEQAVDEMLLKTSTTYAPWVIVEGNSKYYARIKVLENVVNCIEKGLKANEIL